VGRLRTSFLAIVYFVTGTVFRWPDGNVPNWFLAIMAAISRGVCLASAMFGLFRDTRKSKVGSEADVVEIKKKRRFSLDE